MSFYEVLVLIHVLAAIVWVGGAGAYQIRGTHAQARGDVDGVFALLQESEWTGKFVFMPASIILLLAGIWGVIDSPVWEFSQAWVSIGFAAIIVSAVTGAAFLGPEAARIREAADASSRTDPAVAAKLRRWVLVTRVDLVILLIAVWAMVTKPGL